MELSPLSLVGEERVLKGSYMGSCVPSRDIPRFLNLFQTGKLPVDRLVAEGNQGGDLVETVLRQINPMLPFRPVRAARGKGRTGQHQPGDQRRCEAEMRFANHDGLPVDISLPRPALNLIHRAAPASTGSANLARL